MSRTKKVQAKRVLLIGSLPPPHGGGTISFEYFYRYVTRLAHLSITHVDLHVRRVDRQGNYLDRAALATYLRGLATLARVPSTECVVFFASRRMAFSYGLLLILAARLFRKPIHIRLFGGRPYQPIASRPALTRFVTDRILSLASGITLETQTGRNDFPPVVRRRVRAIRGYRPRCEASGAEHEDERGIRFVYAGRVDRSKGIDTLLEACDRLRGQFAPDAFRVDCYGAVTSEFAAACADRPVVRLQGIVPNAVYLAKLAAYDAFVYPSVYENEGHPGAVIEAMLCGLPIVCTALPTVTEIVHDGVEGLLFDAGDSAGLARAMERIISERDLRERLASGSRAAGGAFDLDVVIPELLDEMGLGMRAGQRG